MLHLRFYTGKSILYLVVDLLIYDFLQEVTDSLTGWNEVAVASNINVNDFKMHTEAITRNPANSEVQLIAADI